MGEHFAGGSMQKYYVKQDEYTQSMALLAVDNVRMKADIIRLQDDLKSTQYFWKSIDILLDTDKRQQFELEKLQRKLLTIQIVFGILALSAATAAII